MRVSGAKRDYSELVAHHSWDKDTQIKFFLEYVEEYQLTAHFLSYLALKPVTTVKMLTPSGSYSTDELLRMLSESEEITKIIYENAKVTSVQHPWTEQIMRACIAEALSIAVDRDNRLLIKELLTYFNEKHDLFLRELDLLQSVANDEVTDRYRFGARG